MSRPDVFKWLRDEKLRIPKGRSVYPKITLVQCCIYLEEYVKKYC